MFNRKLLFSVFITIVVILLSFVGLQILQPAKNLSIEVAPDGAQILVNGKPEPAGELALDNGTYTIKAQLAGFSSQSKTINITKELTRVTLLLNPTSQQGNDYLDKHPAEELHREKLGGQLFTDQSTTIVKKNPLIKFLPFIDRYYRIDYGRSIKYPNDTTANAIYITYYTGQARQDAVDYIKFKGVEPSTLELVFVDGNASPDAGGD